MLKQYRLPGFSPGFFTLAISIAMAVPFCHSTPFVRTVFSDGLLL